MDEFVSLIDFDAARLKSKLLENPALALTADFQPDEVKEIFRQIASMEIHAGGFLRYFAAAISVADLENFSILIPSCYKLLAKYPTLIEQYNKNKERHEQQTKND